MEQGRRSVVKKKKKTNIHAVIQACPSLLASFSITEADAPKTVLPLRGISIFLLTSNYLCTSAGFSDQLTFLSKEWTWTVSLTK